MMFRRFSVGFAVTVAIALSTQTESDADELHAALLQKAEARLKAIYERGQYHAPPFNAKWLPDSSGYATYEHVPDSDEWVRVTYRVSDGHRQVVEELNRERQDRLSPDERHVIEIEDGNVWIRDLANETRKQLTDTAVPNTVSMIYAVWSPDGTKVAVEESDASRVRLRSQLVPGDPSYPEVAESRFARVGGVIRSNRVGVVEIESGDIRWFDLSDSSDGFYIGQVEWAKNSDELLIEKLSRFRDERKFLLADVHSGELTCIFQESDPAWTVASYETNAGLEWIGDGEAFLVLSEKDGWRHAFVHSRDGTLLSKLTSGDYDIIERSHIDEVGNWFYFYASPDNATQKYLYRVPLDGSSKPERITPADQPGTHNYDFSPNGRWALHTYSRFDTPPVTQLVEMPDHRVLRAIKDHASIRQRMTKTISTDTEFLQLPIEGGVTLDAWLMKPHDFDPTRKYPVLEYVYGEPHSQTVLDAWGTVHADYHRLIAELGYLVISIDNRGTPAPKGAAWRRAVFGSLGPLSTDEQAAALKSFAETRPYVDLDRVGIWGWSGGGSNTLNSMFRKPDLYHVGIAVAPKPKTHLYNAWFQEIYMNTPEVNPDGYAQAAPINFAEGLQGDLLIIHGTGETNTHIQITEGLVDRLIELGKPFDYMAYPNRDHGIYEGKGTTVHLRMHMLRYLIDHLKPGPL